MFDMMQHIRRNRISNDKGGNILVQTSLSAQPIIPMRIFGKPHIEYLVSCIRQSIAIGKRYNMNGHRCIAGEIEPFKKQPPHIHRGHAGRINMNIGNRIYIVHAFHISRNGRIKRLAST